MKDTTFWWVLSLAFALAGCIMAAMSKAWAVVLVALSVIVIIAVRLF